MNSGLAWVLVVGLGWGALTAPNAGAKTKASKGTDADYVYALATANRFLQAWQNHDHETGLIMLTDAGKQHASEERLEDFFSSSPGTQQAFEINRGKKLKDGRYSFPVALFEMGPERKASHPRFSEVIVVRAGKGEWAVDRLP